VNGKAYRLWAALLHELMRLVGEERPSLRQRWWVKALLDHTRPDWVEWKTELAMREVEQQIVELHQLWEEEQPRQPQPVVTEAAADGSKAQQLLGGELRIRSPWIHD
jgi:hypothetical protein